MEVWLLIQNSAAVVSAPAAPREWRLADGWRVQPRGSREGRAVPSHGEAWSLRSGALHGNWFQRIQVTSQNQGSTWGPKCRGLCVSGPRSWGAGEAAAEPVQ